MKENIYNFDVMEYINSDCLIADNATAEEKDKYLTTMGFSACREQKTGAVYYKFNGNVFAKYLMLCTVIVQNTSDNIYIYNHKGYYQECKPLMFGKIIQFLMNQIEELWTKAREDEAVHAFMRGIKTIISRFNYSEQINLLNGVLDLTTMELHPHSPDFYFTSQIPTVYDPSAKCPLFRKFINDITCQDEALAKVIQEVTGYCLTDFTKIEKAIFFYGMGSNGKSVLANVYRLLVGEENISSVSLPDLNSPFGMESMVNKKINLSAENELNGKRFSTENLKAVISGDMVTIHRKYEKNLQAALTCKLILLLNSLPDVNDMTYGFFRKILIIPFNRTFTEDERDIDLFSKLEKEASGILNYALEGLIRLRENNYRFSYSQAIADVMQVYQMSQNPTMEFWNDTYEYYPGGSILRKEIYEDYMAWVMGTEYSRVAKKEFWKMLRNAAQNPNQPFELEIRKRHGCDYLVNYKRKDERESCPHLIED